MSKIISFCPDPYRIVIQVDELPRMANLSGRGGHWAVIKKEKDRFYQTVNLLIGASRKPKTPFKRAKIHIIRASSIMPDFDGLVHGGKWIIDALRLSGLVENDKIENIGCSDYGWVKAKPKQGHVLISVTGLPDDYDHLQNMKNVME